MNNQLPYGYMPPFFPNNDMQIIMDRIDNLERNIKKLEKKVSILENNIQMPYPNPTFRNEYLK